MIREVKHYLAECDDCKHTIVYIGASDRKPPPLWIFAFAKSQIDMVERTILVCPSCQSKEKLDNWSLVL
jgi:hypothetical protein